MLTREVLANLLTSPEVFFAGMIRNIIYVIYLSATNNGSRDLTQWIST